MSGPDAALAICRLLHDAATMLLWGAFSFLALLVPPGLARDIDGRLSGFRLGAILVAVVTTFGALPLEAAAMGSGWADAMDPATIRAVVFETFAGRVWQVQAGAALLLAATLAVPMHRRASATAASSGLLLALLGLTGHAAMHAGWLGLAHRVNDAVHVLAGGAWLGALLPLLRVLAALDQPGRRKEAGRALRRFSSAGHGAVAAVLATGALNTMLVLGRVPTPWSSPYQALLAGKIVLVLAMSLLALVNRYVLVPRMPDARDRVVASLRAATLAEVGLGVAVIGCVAVFGLLDPA